MASPGARGPGACGYYGFGSFDHLRSMYGIGFIYIASRLRRFSAAECSRLSRLGSEMNRYYRSQAHHTLRSQSECYIMLLWNLR